MRLALGEDGDQHIGAGDFVTARRLDVDDRALDDALETGRWLGLFRLRFDQRLQVGLDIGVKRGAQLGQIDVASTHDGRCIDIIDEGQQEMLKRRVFVMMRIGVPNGTMQSFL